MQISVFSRSEFFLVWTLSWVILGLSSRDLHQLPLRLARKSRLKSELVLVRNFFAKIERRNRAGQLEYVLCKSWENCGLWSGAISSIEERSQPEVTKKPTPWFHAARSRYFPCWEQLRSSVLEMQHSIDDRTLKWSYGSSHAFSSLLELPVPCSKRI